MIKQLFSKLFLLTLHLPESPFKKILRDLFYGEVVSERIIEYSLVFNYLNYTPLSLNQRVLDVGCYYSNLPIQLASLGYQVTAIDLQAYQLTHPNFKFVQGDICSAKFPHKFDLVTAISTIEHIGIDYYDPKSNSNGDRLAVANIHNLLKPKGKFILSVPFGLPAVTNSYRSYDWPGLQQLLQGFTIKTKLFFLDRDTKWLPCSQSEAGKVANHTDRSHGLAFIVAQKK